MYYLTIAKFRKAFVWLRLGVNVLIINNRYNDRSKLCPVENERHFLLKCPKYNVLREKYISKYCINSSETPLALLLQNDNIYVTRSVAVYLYHAFKDREELIKDYRCPC